MPPTPPPCTTPIRGARRTWTRVAAGSRSASNFDQQSQPDSTLDRLLRHTGILAGSSSGTLLAAALRYCREQREPRRVCTLVCDTGNKYLSKMYDDRWLEAHGFGGHVSGATADLLARPRAGPRSWLRPTDTLREAALRMRHLGLSALPVVEGSRVLGVVTESHLLEAMLGGQASLDRPAVELMPGGFGTVSPRASLRELVPLLEASDLAVVTEGVELVGVVTRLDVLEHLRMARN